MGQPTIVWRRVDLEGREAATVAEVPVGWRIFGAAELREMNARSCVAYVIECNRAWETNACDITGFVRDRAVAMSIHRDANDVWTVDGVESPAVAGCIDIDLAFSPVTNVLPIRRLMLGHGEAANVRAAWLRFPELTVEVLEQTYRRIAADRYVYESANGAFRRELTVDGMGLVVEYPGLWTRDEPDASG
jgi:hypothetical protein